MRGLETVKAEKAGLHTGEARGDSNPRGGEAAPRNGLSSLAISYLDHHVMANEPTVSHLVRWDQRTTSYERHTLRTSQKRDNQSQTGEHGVIGLPEEGSHVNTGSGDLLSVLVTAAHNTDVLADGRTLGSLGQVVREYATSCGADVLVAASPSAERLVGAALMLAPDTLRGLRSSEAISDKDVVLVIDVNLASGTAMATTARQVRRQGAEHVLGVVMHFLADNVPSARDCGLDELAVFGLPRDPIAG